MGIASDFVLIVIAGLLGGIVARLLRLPLLVGYVAAGVAVGPYTAGPTVVALHDIELLAEIGVALLLFSLGLEISLRDLQPVRRIAFIGGPLQILLTIAAGAIGGYYALGMSGTESIWFGSMVSVSSTMVVLKTLAADGVTSTLASRVMIGLLVIQDLAVIPMLAILPQLNSLDGLGMNLARSIGVAALLLGIVAFAGTRVFPKVLQMILKWGSRELFLVAVVAIGVGVGAAAHAVGMSFALGAFVAGMVLSESDFSHQALSDVVPLRDIFGLLFFVTVGMLFDPHYAIANAWRVAITVALIFAGKAAIIGLLTRAFSYANHAPWIVGLGLSQIGEFSFVLARTGFSGGLLTKPTYDLALTCTVLTMALSPLVSSLAIPLGRRFRTAAPTTPMDLPQHDLSDHVIVAGYGRTGRAAALALRAANIPIIIVESNHAALEDIRREGFEAIWGDIASPEILHAAHADRARLLVLAIPDRNATHLAIDRARHLHRDLKIVARALRERHVAELQHMHIAAIVQPEFEGGIEMVRQALILYGRPDSEANTITAQLRSDLYNA